MSGGYLLRGIPMTKHHTDSLRDFITEVHSRAMDSLEFAQLMFTVEEIVGDDEDFHDPLLQELVQLVMSVYPAESETWVKDLDGAAKKVVLRYAPVRNVI